MIDKKTIQKHNQTMSQTPLINISKNIFPTINQQFYKNKKIIIIKHSITQSIKITNNVPIILPITNNTQYQTQITKSLNNLLLSKKTNINPSSYNQKNNQ